MSISITIQNELVQKLESEARRWHVSVEELATSILYRAVTTAPDAWSARNQRRLTLIRQSLGHSLTAEEQHELDALQSALDERFDDFDAALQAQLDLIQAAIR